MRQRCSSGYIDSGLFAFDLAEALDEHFFTALDVLSEVLRCGGGVPGADGVLDWTVLAGGLLGASGEGSEHAPGECAPEPLDVVLEARGSGRAIDEPVPGVVDGDRVGCFPLSAGGDELGVKCLELGQCRVVHLWDGEFERVRFEDCAKVADLLHVLDGLPCYHHAVVRPVHDEPFRLEYAQGFADRCGTHREFGLEMIDHQPVARREVAGEDPLAQLLRGEVGLRHGIRVRHNDSVLLVGAAGASLLMWSLAQRIRLAAALVAPTPIVQG